MAVALVTELEASTKAVVWRHLEIHADGVVEHALYRGTRAKLGSPRRLDEQEETAELTTELDENGDRYVWNHRLPMLMGRVSNGRKRVKRLGNLGVSDLYAIRDDLLDLNEAKTIGSENMRLTAKRRVVVPESALTPNDSVPFKGSIVDRGDGIMVPSSQAGRFDAGEDVLVTTALDAELGRDPAGAFKVLEYTFDAGPLIDWKRDLIESALTRAGLTPQSVGVVTGQGDGLALSGTALRLRLIPQTRAGRGKARPWDDELPKIIGLMALVDALPPEDGGFGRGWTDPVTMPAIEREEELPHDEVEDAQVEATLVGARVRSRLTSIRNQHPDWTDEQVDEELAAIDSDAATSSANLLGAIAAPETDPPDLEDDGAPPFGQVT
jgi:hypothetical protein